MKNELEPCPFFSQMALDPPPPSGALGITIPEAAQVPRARRVHPLGHTAGHVHY